MFFHVGLRRRQVVEGEHAVDQRPDAPVGDGRQQVGDKSRYTGGTLVGAAQLVRDAEQGQAFRMQRLEIDLGLQLVVDIADGGEPTFEGQRAHALREHAATDGVDDEVDAMAARGFQRLRCKVGCPRVDGNVQTQGLQPGQLLGRSRRADDVGPERLRHLQRGDADARRHAGHEQPFAGLQTTLQHQHVVHDQEGQRQRRCSFHRQACRHRQRLATVHQRVLGEGADTPAHDPLADDEPGDSGAQRDDLARAFDARGLGSTALDEAARNELAPVQRRGMHLQQHLAGGGCGRGHLTRLQQHACALDTQRIRFHQRPLKCGLRFSMKARRPSA